MKLCLKLTDTAIHPQSVVVGPAKAWNHMFLKVFHQTVSIKDVLQFFTDQPNLWFFLNPNLVLQKCLLGKESTLQHINT